MLPDSSLTVDIAYDNFNQSVETLSGKDTLHDTVGIVYQSVSEETCGAAATALDKSSFFKWGFKEWKKEKKKKLRNFLCGYQALS